MTFSINDTQHNNSLHYAECHCPECRILFIVMLSFIMLNVVMLSVVVALKVVSVNSKLGHIGRTDVIHTVASKVCPCLTVSKLNGNV